MPSDPAPPPPPPPPKPQPKPAKGSWRGSFALGSFLALLLVAGWAVYLLLAPEPVVISTPPLPEVPAAPPDQVVFLAPADAVDADMLAGFDTDTGLKLTLTTYATPEELEALLQRPSAFDLVLVTGNDIRRLLAAGGLQALPAARLTNFANLDPVLMARAAVYDPGNLRSVPLLWSTVGLGFDAAKLNERLGAAAVESWSVLFDPERAAKLADCGIQAPGAPMRGFAIALQARGLPLDSDKTEDTEAAFGAWEAVRPHVRTFSSGDIAAALGEGRVCLAVATSADIVQARARARAAGATGDIGFALPKEGALLQMNLLGVPAAAANPGNGLKLADYLLRPEVAARLTNGKGYGNAVPRSELYIRPEIKNDAALTPSADVLARLAPETDVDAVAGLRARFWGLISATSPRGN
jgi:putrescine transport system substrate-binding protein